MSELAAILAEGRAEADARMTATCTIRRENPDAAPVRNPTTGQLEQPTEVIYSGICEIKFDSSALREVDAQAQDLTEQEPTLKLPVADTEMVTVDDTGVIDTSPLNPGQVGTKFKIAGIHEQTHSTSRRLPIEITT